MEDDLRYEQWNAERNAAVQQPAAETESDTPLISPSEETSTAQGSDQAEPQPNESEDAYETAT
jgi:hypothetical protein